MVGGRAHLTGEVADSVYQVDTRTTGPSPSATAMLAAEAVSELSDQYTEYTEYTEYTVELVIQQPLAGRRVTLSVVPTGGQPGAHSIHGRWEESSATGYDASATFRLQLQALKELTLRIDDIHFSASVALDPSDPYIFVEVPPLRTVVVAPTVVISAWAVAQKRRIAFPSLSRRLSKMRP